MSFFSELRRRNVFRVGAAYAITAWLLIQVADVVLPTFNAPPWVMQVFTFLVILGFPLTLIVAWAYELTPEGLKTASSIQHGEPVTRSTAHRFNYFIVGLLALAIGFLLVGRLGLERGVQTSVSEVTGSATGAPTMENRAGSAASNATQPITTSVTQPVRRFVTSLGATEPVSNTGLGAHIALSPDGTRLAYVAQVDGSTQLYLRDLDQLEARALPGTEGAVHPFFSPDGEWIAFYSDETDHKLKKISIRGGLPQTLADAPNAPGGSWRAPDTIVFATQNASGARALLEIPAAGGTPETLLSPTNDTGHVWPQSLPGGEAVLFVIRPGSGGGGNARDGSIAVLSRDTGEFRTLVAGGFRPRYAPTGHLIFVRAGSLWAVPFDLERLVTTGPEVLVIQGVQQDGFIGGASYTFSDDGMLAYIPGGDTGGAGGAAGLRRLVWVDREGNEEPLPAPPRPYFGPRLSPDGRRLATRVIEDGSWDIWIDDLARGISSRLTFDAAIDFSPVWTPDSKRVVFASFRDGGSILSRAADGTGSVETHLTTSGSNPPLAVSPDGSILLFAAGGDLHVLSLQGEPNSRYLLQTPQLNESLAALSPDGRWVVYQSNDPTGTAIFVRPFPNVDDGRWQVSPEGGTDPRWASNGQELYYRDGDSLVAVTVETEPTFSAGTPNVLFTGTFVSSTNAVRSYDVAPDGQRFLMMRGLEQSNQGREDTQLIVVENWFEELKRLAPPAE